MARIWLHGDIHGDNYCLEKFCEENETTRDDVVVILGDAGYNYYGKSATKEFLIKESAADLPISIFCVRGNHEDRPENRGMKPHPCAAGPLKGLMYTEEKYPNIFYAVDGEVYQGCGKSFLVVGGAYSIDKYYRLMMHWQWFKDEQLTGEERTHILDKCQGKHFDYVLTHTCPYSWQPVELFIGNVDESMVDSSMERWFEELESNISYNHWYFGHYHGDKYDITGDGKVTMLFNDFVLAEEEYGT